MNTYSLTAPLLVCSLAVVFTACGIEPGAPKPGLDVPRPDQVVDFATLYSANCAACHGAGGKLGAAISLANPVYLATAGVANIQRVTSQGVPGTMMPPFLVTAGGMLTAQQIEIIARGILKAWANPATLHGQIPPPYAGVTLGDSATGRSTYATFCSRCHSKDSLSDPAYLALISDQGLRSIIIAGQPDQGMPDWRSCLTGAGARAMTDREISDSVAWLTSHRVDTPGQPYGQRPLKTEPRPQ